MKNILKFVVFFGFFLVLLGFTLKCPSGNPAHTVGSMEQESSVATCNCEAGFAIKVASHGKGLRNEPSKATLPTARLIQYTMQKCLQQQSPCVKLEEEN
jgi:hypothetical protein